MRGLIARGSKTRLIVTTAVLAFVIAILAQAGNASAGHPDQGSPIGDAVLLFVLILLIRVGYRRLVRFNHRKADERNS